MNITFAKGEKKHVMSYTVLVSLSATHLLEIAAKCRF